MPGNSRASLKECGTGTAPQRKDPMNGSGHKSKHAGLRCRHALTD